ncbi:MAG TPA: MoxR family ATPase [Gammaproteobacteria bacterium]|nr:MoxR family ATPase [Gammaproteobacteria bacterium]
MTSTPRTIPLTPAGNEDINAVIGQANRIILGKENVIRLALACLIARGHLLIEDLPGVGKTTLAHVLANTLGLGFQRIQFTSDLLPADILGVSIYNRETGGFNFHPGPIFTQVILADEVNRTTPRTQSALLEAMEENQVTIEGETRPLPTPFFVIATQNPSDQVGTFPLPESQLDRFMMRVELGYPDSGAERELLMGTDRRRLLQQASAIISPERLLALQEQAEGIHVSAAILDYLQDLLEYSRNSGEFRNGLSPRAGLAALHCSRAWALMEGHRQVLPEHVQSILPSVISHRLTPSGSTLSGHSTALAEELINQVPIP